MLRDFLPQPCLVHRSLYLFSVLQANGLERAGPGQARHERRVRLTCRWAFGPLQIIPASACRQTAPEARWILAGECQPPVNCNPPDPPRQGRRKNVSSQEKTGSQLLILEPGVRRFRGAFIVAKAASTVSGAPAGAHHAER